MGVGGHSGVALGAPALGLVVGWADAGLGLWVEKGSKESSSGKHSSRKASLI